MFKYYTFVNMKSRTTINILIVVIIALLSGMFYLVNNASSRYDIMQKDLTEYQKRTEDLQKKIKQLNESNAELATKIEDYESTLADLSKIKKETITKYRDKQKLIDSTGDLAVLDSLIRANSGLPQR